MNNPISNQQQILEDIESLEKILTRENKALAGTFTVNLADIVAEKQTIIENITAYALTPDALASLGSDAHAALNRCRKLNEDNNHLVNQRLKIVRQANAIVVNHTNAGSVELYDQMGKIVMESKNTTLIEV